MSVCFETAIGGRKCTKCGKWTIKKGDKCINFYGGGRFTTSNNLCKYCVIEFIITVFGRTAISKKVRQEYESHKLLEAL